MPKCPQTQTLITIGLNLLDTYPELYLNEQKTYMRWVVTSVNITNSTQVPIVTVSLAFS